MKRPENSYMPSNGTEGMDFIYHFCENCIHEKFMHDPDNLCPEKDGCSILTNSMVNDWVPEWIYKEDGRPTCTEFQKWDWGKDDNNDWNEPPRPPKPPDPRQINLFPLLLGKYAEEEKEKILTTMGHNHNKVK